MAQNDKMTHKLVGNQDFDPVENSSVITCIFSQSRKAGNSKGGGILTIGLNLAPPNKRTLYYVWRMAGDR